jgi:hypothetical protein
MDIFFLECNQLKAAICEADRENDRRKQQERQHTPGCCLAGQSAHADTALRTRLCTARSIVSCEVECIEPGTRGGHKRTPCCGPQHSHIAANSAINHLQKRTDTNSYDAQGHSIRCTEERTWQSLPENQLVRVWRLEKLRRNPKGEKYCYNCHVAASLECMWRHCLPRRDVQPHVYEIIRRDQPCNLYFDLEYDPAKHPHVDGDVLVLLLLDIAFDVIRYDSS